MNPNAQKRQQLLNLLYQQRQNSAEQIKQDAWITE